MIGIVLFKHYLNRVSKINKNKIKRIYFVSVNDCVLNYFICVLFSFIQNSVNPILK